MVHVPDAVVDEFVSDGVNEALTRATQPLRGDTPRPTDDPFDIVIPIYNAPGAVQECIRRVLRFSPPECTVWLVDDASTDPGIEPLLRKAEKDPRVRTVRRSENTGYVASCNDMLERTHGDVVLLNSDTEVTEGWYGKLREAATQDGDIGIVCPLSDNATLLTVIGPAAVDEAGVDAVAAHVDAASRERFPDIPVAVGFCMLIRRRLIDAIGVFDPVFGAGYGEEVDYSMRAWQAGFRIVAATHCFVRHVGSRSFSQRAEVRQLRRFNEQLIDTRWPGYRRWVQEWWRDSPLRLNAERLRYAARVQSGPRVLHVVHRLNYLGGTEGVTRNIARGLQERYPATLAAVSTGDLGWADAVGTLSTHAPATVQVNRRYRYVNQRLVRLAADLRQPWIERLFARILMGGDYALIHFHHLVNWDSLLLPLIARRLGARIVISLHDFFYLCPDYAQLRIPGFRSCGKDRAIADTDCEPCLEARRWVRPDVEMGELGLYLETRHAIARRVLEAADLITAPSEYSAARCRRTFGDTVAGKLAVIPHGIDRVSTATRARPTAGLVVGYFGGTVPHKGFGLVCEVARGLRNLSVEFHVYGAVTPEQVPDDLPENMRLFGKYRPEQMGELLAVMDVVMIPSRVEETFSLILSEAWSAGVPVLAANHGAFPERMTDGEDGWLLDPYSEPAWLDKLMYLASAPGRKELGAVAERVGAKTRRTVEAMVEDYAGRYQRVLAGTRYPAQGRMRRTQDNGPELDASTIRRAGRQYVPGTKPRPFIVATARNRWAAAQYRVDIPLAYLHRQGCLETPLIYRTGKQAPPSLVELLAYGADAIMGHNLISDPALARLADYRERSMCVIGSLDDYLLDVPAYNSFAGTYPDMQSRLKRALSLYDRLVVSTPLLQEYLSGLCGDIVVVPNALPESPWFDRETPGTEREGTRLRVGWAGAGQHGGDLEAFENVVRRTHRDVDWVFLGMCTDALRLWVSEVHPMVPFAQYPQRLRDMRLDVGVAPLIDNAFNRCKSNIKLLEYGALGMAAIASDLDPYRESPVSLARSEDDWVELIMGYARDRQSALDDGSELQRWVRAGHLIKHRKALWLRTLGIEDRST